MIKVTRIDSYKVVKLIGRGGQGEVIHVRDENQTDFALKWLLPHMVNRAVVDRFHREFNSIEKLDHPNIIRVFNKGIFMDRPYFTMELVHGDNLEDFLFKEKDFEIYYEILIQIGNALAYIHKNRLVHRDIKTSNILIDNKGQARLMDFGLVKNLDASVQLTRVDHFFGTMAYAPPEQFLGEKIDYRSDLYSFGIVMYRMFSGQLPFRADSLIAMATKHLSSVPPSLCDVMPNCSKRLSDLCDRLLKKSPWDRPSSAEEVVQILNSLNQNQSIVLPKVIHREAEIRYIIQPRFINRETEMMQLISSVNHCNSLSIQFLSGPQGIGKTRLLNEAARNVIFKNLSVTVMRCSGHSHKPDSYRNSLFNSISREITNHLNALGDLAGILPEIAPLHPSFEQFDQSSNRIPSASGRHTLTHKIRYLSAICAHLTQIKPWLIIWDDIHLATPFEIECLKDLMELSHHETIRCQIWGSVRNDDFDTPETMELFVKSFQPSGTFGIIRLNPFEQSVAIRFISEFLNKSADDSIVFHLAEFCGGNPAIIVQTIQRWIEAGDLIASDGGYRYAHKTEDRPTLGPIQHEDIVKEQLSSLPETARNILSWISILKENAYLEVLRCTATYSEKELLDNLNDLIKRHILVSDSSETGERYVIANPVISRVSASFLSEETVQHMNIEAVGILEHLGGPFAQPNRLARHQEEALNFYAACKNYFAWASTLFESNQLVACRDTMDHAYHIMENLSLKAPSIRLLHQRMTLLYAGLMRKIGTMDEKELLAEELIEILPNIQGQSDRNAIFSFLASFYTTKCDFDRAVSMIREYELTVQTSQDEAILDLLSLKAYLHFFKQEYADSRIFLKKQFQMQKARNASVGSMTHTLSFMAKTVMWSGYPNAAIRLLLYAFQQLPSNLEIEGKSSLLAEIGNAYMFKKDYTRSIMYTEKALLINSKLGLEYNKACNLHDIGISNFFTGNIKKAAENISESEKVFRILKNPREYMILASTSISISVAEGKFQKALDTWQSVSRDIGEGKIFSKHPDLPVTHHMTLTLSAGQHQSRVFLGKILSTLTCRNRERRKETIRRLLFRQYLAENRLAKADRLLASDTTSSLSPYLLIPGELQLFVLRIIYRPDQDHTELLDEDLFLEMGSLPSVTEERNILIRIAHSQNIAADKEAILSLIEQLQSKPARIWYFEILAYFAGRQGLVNIKNNAKKLAETTREDIASRLQGEANREFLSRLVIARI